MVGRREAVGASWPCTLAGALNYARSPPSPSEYELLTLSDLSFVFSYAGRANRSAVRTALAASFSPGVSCHAHAPPPANDESVSLKEGADSSPNCLGRRLNIQPQSAAAVRGAGTVLRAEGAGCSPRGPENPGELTAQACRPGPTSPTLGSSSGALSHLCVS